MTDDIDPTLSHIDHQLDILAHAALPSHIHRMRLRSELMLRHAERVERGRPRRMLVPTRLTLALSPVLAIAAAIALFLSGSGLSGHGSAPAVEAARITAALARTVPTVTGVQLTYHRERAGESEQYRCLQGGQHLYIRGLHAYIYSNGTWYQLNTLSSTGKCPEAWQLAFADLPARLATHRFSLLDSRVVDGVSAIGIRYAVPGTSHAQDIVTAWVDHDTGLIVRLARVRMRNGVVVERDFADYRYQRAP